MRTSSLVISLLIAFTVALWLTGCGTIRTMPNLGNYGSPKVYSGTRLDYNAARGDMAGLENFKVGAPEHPSIDLPFSALLDTFILPITFSVAAYEFVFE
jgi:uncharacterized protein YceK